MLNVQDELVYFNVLYTGANEKYGVSSESFFNAIEEHLKTKPIFVVSATNKNCKTYAELLTVDIEDVFLIAKEFKDGVVGVARSFNKFNLDLDEISNDNNCVLSAKYIFNPETKSIEIISFNLICT